MLTIYLNMIETREDRDKFSMIYANYKGLIFSEARKMTNDCYLIDDISQDTFVKIINNISTLRYDNDREFAALIRILTRNAACECLRKNGKYVYPNEMPLTEAEKDEANRERIVINAIRYREVMEEIEKMGPMFSGPLMLKVKGYSSEEIGKLLDISPQNARIRIYRAKKMIMEKLGE